jgi:hypothetical protein
MIAMDKPRPRLARFDRPALHIDDLMAAHGEDFVHIAYWTLAGRRAKPEEIKTGIASLDGGMTREHLLMVLAESYQLSPKDTQLPHLKKLLAEQRRRRIPLVGELLISIDSALGNDRTMLRARVYVQRAAGAVRWSYRHSRKALIRTIRQLGRPAATIVRRIRPAKHANPTTGMSNRAIEIYDLLCRALDKRDDFAR